MSESEQDTQFQSTPVNNETNQQTETKSDDINQNEDERKFEEEEEEEDDEEDKIVEKSSTGRFHKRNKRFPRHVPGTDNAYVAIEPKSGKEVIWNEIELPEKKTEYENQFLSVIKKLKKASHPFLIRFLDAWVAKMENGKRKMVFVTERLDEATLKQFMCNSERSTRLWKRHVGQLLSVLKFLREVGVAMHGNLTNETIYYQSSGNLKIGTFAMVDLFNSTENLDDVVLKARKKYLAPEYDAADVKITPAVDIYALGVISLELIVWDLADQTNDNGQAKSYKDVIESAVQNPFQKDFICSCLAENPEERPSLNSLINHPAMIEVPTLKLLSARVIVDHMRLNSDENQGESSTSSFATLLRDYSSYLEDDTVVVEIYKISSNDVKSKTWKDFRSNFTLTSKYLEDVKSNFYPFFGCIPPSTRRSYEDNYKESEDVAYFQSMSPDQGQSVGGGNDEGKVSSIITPSGSNQGLNFDSGVRSRDDDCSLGSKENQIGVLTSNITSGSSTTKLPDVAPDKAIPAKGESNTSYQAGYENSIPDSLHPTSQISLKEDGAGINRSPHPLDVVDDSTRTKQGEGNEGIVPNSISRHAVSSTSGVDSGQSENLLKITQDSNDQLETSVHDDEDEDEDEIERSKKERPNEPQLVHVLPPNKAPLHSALFTHCEYSYVGCGRWQIYVQMWFVEDRLKREGFIQVLDFEWHNIEYVASLFEASRSIAPEDRNRLMRLLDCARHSWPLVDGELKPPRSQLANFDAYELHEKLLMLQQHQQARELFEAVSTTSAPEPDAKIQAQIEQNDASIKKSTDVSSNKATTRQSNDATAPSKNQDDTNLAPAPSNISKGQSVSNISPNCRTDDNAANESSTAGPVVSSKTATSVPASVSEPSKNLLKGIKVGQLDKLNLSTMIDVGVLAPRNHECAICDKHDYLHSKDLPPYLTSPCYHCREALASEAKLTPEALYDAHLQHQIPWPAFLQARFNIPQDERTFDELISYDCRWRSRLPCCCYSSTSPLPPCVEFPWLYQGVVSQSSQHSDAKVNDVPANVESAHVCSDTPEIVEDGKKVTDSDNIKTAAVSDNQSVVTNQSIETTPRADISTNQRKISGPLSHSTSPAPSEGGPVKPAALQTFSNYLPCSSRHEKGAPMTCSHGYNFPNLMSSHHTNQKKLSRT